MAKMSQPEEDTIPLMHEPQWILCFYFFALTTFTKTSQFLLKPIFKMTNKPSPEELSLRNKMRIIRTQQLRISIKDDFATHAKLQRQLIKLEDELKETIQERLEKNVKLKLTIQYGFNIVANILLIFSIIYSRHIPLIVLKHDLYPFESLFGYASGVPHAVTSHAWVIMTRVSIDVIMKATVKISEFKQQNSEPSSPTVS